MKCQILFSGKNKENISNLSSAELAKKVVKVDKVKPYDPQCEETYLLIQAYMK